MAICCLPGLLKQILPCLLWMGAFDGVRISEKKMGLCTAHERELVMEGAHARGMSSAYLHGNERGT